MTLHDPSQSGRGSGQTGRDLNFYHNWQQLDATGFTLVLLCVIIQWGHSMVGICWGSIFLLKPKKLGNIMTYSLGDPMISWDGTPPRQGTLRNLVVTTISFMVVFNSIRQTTKQTLVNLRWWLMIFFTNSTWCYENLFGRDWDLKVNGFCIFLR